MLLVEVVRHGHEGQERVNALSRASPGPSSLPSGPLVSAHLHPSVRHGILR